MSSHSVHPDSHLHGLADDCERCAEHAEHPLRSLDNRNLRVLMHRIIDGDGARSSNEQTAMDQIEEGMHIAGQIASVDRALLAQYILDKWGIAL